MCAAPEQGQDLEGIDVTRETIIQGVVTADGGSVAGAYVRLLDGNGEFTAEVVTSPTGQFRFFAAPGSWTLRALSPVGHGTADLTVAGGVNEASLVVSA